MAISSKVARWHALLRSLESNGELEIRPRWLTKTIRKVLPADKASLRRSRLGRGLSGSLPICKRRWIMEFRSVGLAPSLPQATTSLLCRQTLTLPLH
jgi:hypothetical protein